MNPFAALPERLLDAQPALWFGLALLVALMLGEALRRSGRVPAVCAYVAVGLLAGPAGLGLISDDAGIWRQPLIDLALGVVMFELGHRVRLRWVWDNRWLALTSAAEMLLAFLAVFVALLVLGAVPGTSAALVALVAMSTAPMAVMAAIYDARTRGQVSERLLLLSALNSLVAVVAVRMWLVIGSDSRAAEGAAGLVQVLSWAQPLYVVLLSALLGLGVGWVTEMATRLLRLRPQPGTLPGGGRSHAHQQVVVLAVVVIGATLATQLQLSVLLVMFIAGSMGHARLGRSLALEPHLGTAGVVLWVFLFMSIGAAGTLEALWSVWPLVILVLLARAAGKMAACVALARASGLTWRQGAAVGLGLQPLSIVALLLSAEMLIGLPGFDPAAMQAMLIACTLMELAGPWITQTALRRVAHESVQADRAGETVRAGP